MTTKFFAVLTNLGAAKLANATALGTQLQITQMAVGDGGGTLPLPNAAQTQLIGEKRRAALNSLSIDAANSSQIIAEQVIPETEGGWWIREIGLLDKDGVLIAIANCPETYKPQLQEGSGRTQTVRMVLIVSSTDAVTLKIDPSVVLATRKYVDDQVIIVKAYADNLLVEHEKSRDHPDASLTAKGFAKYSSAIDSNSEVLAATPKAVKTVSDAALKTANNLSEIAAAGATAVASTLANLGLSDFANMTDVRKLIDAAFPIGVPIPYPVAAIPETAMGVVFFKMNGGTFSTTTYPKLALKYPTGVLPDMRGEFMRGWDDGRGVDSGRVILSAQASTWIQPNIETSPAATTIVVGNTDGVINPGAIGGVSGIGGGTGSGSRVSYYIRPRNLAFNYIVRAA
ncbi:tail fiber protein [Yersinia rohdei]|uniref:phage tail protein n=1 Tax=Yersinia rohdei TaxID=29485 RepID=UPI0005E275F7|nr:phage tail protein [Yersinia rohdei]CNI36926.1 tail fiber protein [Yersinia rohdei]